MGRLIVVTVESLLRFDAVFFHEADAADGVGVQHLFVGRHDLAADLIVGRRDRPHLMFHNLSPLYIRWRQIERTGPAGGSW